MQLLIKGSGVKLSPENNYQCDNHIFLFQVLKIYVNVTHLNTQKTRFNFCEFYEYFFPWLNWFSYV